MNMSTTTQPPFSLPTPAPAPKRRLPQVHLGWLLLIGQVAVYLHMMAQADWQFDRGHWMLFGSPGIGVSIAHGSAMPYLLREGDWHRLLLDPFLETSLISLLFSVWINFRFAKQLQGLAGLSRAFVIAMAGGAGGAALQAWQFPETSLGGGGTYGMMLGLLGGMAGWGFSKRNAARAPIRRFVIRWLIGFAIICAIFAFVMGSDLEKTGALLWPALVGGLVSGIVAMLLFLPRSLPRPVGMPSRVVGFAVLGLLASAVWIQAPRALAGNEAAKRVLQLREAVKWVETTARSRVWKKRRVPQEDRQQLAEAIYRARDIEWTEKWSGRPALEEWLACFEPFVTGDLPDPDGLVRLRMPKAWEAYQAAEGKLAVEAGLRPRTSSVWIRSR
jgi:membrane associated rhomboid family serine protease